MILSWILYIFYSIFMSYPVDNISNVFVVLTVRKGKKKEEEEGGDFEGKRMELSWHEILGCLYTTLFSIQTNFCLYFSIFLQNFSSLSCCSFLSHSLEEFFSVVFVQISFFVIFSSRLHFLRTFTINFSVTAFSSSDLFGWELCFKTEWSFENDRSTVFERIFHSSFSFSTLIIPRSSKFSLCFFFSVFQFTCECTKASPLSLPTSSSFISNKNLLKHHSERLLCCRFVWSFYKKKPNFFFLPELSTFSLFDYNHFSFLLLLLIVKTSLHRYLCSVKCSRIVKPSPTPKLSFSYFSSLHIFVAFFLTEYFYNLFQITYS